MSKRQDGAALTRQKIVDAVRELCTQKDADKITIAEITERAGVAKGTFYIYFKRKEDVISEISYENFDQLMAAASNGNCYDRINVFLIGSIEIIEDNTVAIAQQWMKATVDPVEKDGTGVTKYDYDSRFITRCLEDDIAKGKLRPDTPVELICKEIMSQYYGIVTLWCLSDGKIDPHELVEFYCLHSLKEILKRYKNEVSMQYITLNDGVKIPQIGFGTFLIPNNGSTYKAVSEALKAGYRHIDTAAAYFNEEEVGKAIADSGIPREEIFVTSKLWLQDYGYEAAKKGIERSLKHLGTYIDLYLIHQPYGDVPGAWKALEEAVADGKIRSIGVSNMTPAIWKEFVPQFDTKPSVNQVEFNPYFQQHPIRELMDEEQVVLEAWAPIGQGSSELLTEPVILELAEKYKKDPAQIIIRSQLQDGVVTLPKSTNPEHMASNLDVFDFELTDKEIEKIHALDRGHGTHDPDAPGVAEMLLNAFVIED